MTGSSAVAQPATAQASKGRAWLAVGNRWLNGCMTCTSHIRFESVLHVRGRERVYRYYISQDFVLGYVVGLWRPRRTHCPQAEGSAAVHFAWGLVSRDPQVSQPTHLTLTYKLMSSYFGVRGVGWETYGSLETSEKLKGR